MIWLLTGNKRLSALGHLFCCSGFSWGKAETNTGWVLVLQLEGQQLCFWGCFRLEPRMTSNCPSVFRRPITSSHSPRCSKQTCCLTRTNTSWSLTIVSCQIPENPPEYQKYYRQMNKVPASHIHWFFNKVSGCWCVEYLCTSGRIPLQHSWLRLDRGWLHGRRPEVNAAAGGALSLHQSALHPRAPVWSCQRGEPGEISTFLFHSCCILLLLLDFSFCSLILVNDSSAHFSYLLANF